MILAWHLAITFAALTGQFCEKEVSFRAMQGKEDGEAFFKGIPEWSDDMRMEKLLGPLPPSRDIDTDHWDNSMKFWQRVILDACLHFNTMAFSEEQLKARFTRKGIVPMCLEDVLV